MTPETKDLFRFTLMENIEGNVILQIEGPDITFWRGTPEQALQMAREFFVKAITAGANGYGRVIFREEAAKRNLEGFCMAVRADDPESFDQIISGYLHGRSRA